MTHRPHYGMRVEPDDELFRVRAVWLGPTGFTFPWQARYLSYVVWLVTFLAILLFKALTPLHVGIPPMWEIAISVGFTYWFMGLVDFEQPIRSRLETFRAEVTAPRPSRRTGHVITSRVRVRERRPLSNKGDGA